MAIYRGPGGPGDATTDAASEAALVSTLVTQAQTSAANASTSANNANTSATNAANSATSASTSASSAAASLAAIGSSVTDAANSATSAASSASAAATSATNAANSATSAGSSATSATASASAASSSASSASTSASNAASSASSASTSATNAAASYDSFDDRYLGAKSSAPTLDNDGNALLTGALYWNTTTNQLYVWDGSAWDDAAFNTVGVLFSTDIGVTVQGYDADTAKLDVAQSFTAQQTFKEVKDTVHTITDGAAFEIDPANGSIQVVTLGANRTPAATNFEAGQVVLLGIDDGTAYTITWTTVNPTWVKVGGTASAPTLATTGYTWILLWKVGSTVYATEVGKP